MGAVEEDIETLRTFIRKKRRERNEDLAVRLARARSDFNRIVEMIITEFCPERVYQWGSLIDGKGFSEISDIDIAVEGVTEPERFALLNGKARELTSFPLHIVQLETLHPVHASEIKENGKLIYARPI
jgi:predicted nucleotidyltransferase